MLTIHWQLPRVVAELKKKPGEIEHHGIILLAIAIVQLLKHPYHYILGMVMIAAGIAFFFYYRRNGSLTVSPFIKCSLAIGNTGLIVIVDDIRDFIFFKDINLINSDDTAICIHIDSSRHKPSCFMIPAGALNVLGKQTFFDEITRHLPQINKINLEIVNAQNKPWLRVLKTPSWGWVYFGIALSVIFFTAIALSM